jgi:RNA polymerase sigma-70 factor (ECF subfamily)
MTKDWMSKALPDVLPIVYLRVLNSVRDAELAWDAASDACVVALTAPEKFDGDDKKLTKWLTKVAKHKALDRLKRKRPLPLPNGGEQQIAARQDPPAVERHEIHTKVRQCLARLSEEDQAILNLKHVEGLTFQEIGNLLYGEEKTPGGRLQHARNRFVKAEARLCRLLLEEGVASEDWWIE